MLDVAVGRTKITKINTNAYDHLDLARTPPWRNTNTDTTLNVVIILHTMPYIILEQLLQILASTDVGTAGMKSR